MSGIETSNFNYQTQPATYAILKGAGKNGELTGRHAICVKLFNWIGDESTSKAISLIWLAKLKLGFCENHTN